MRKWIVTLALLCAAPALAADGDPCVDGTHWHETQRGPHWCRIALDGKTTGSGTVAAPLDLRTVPNRGVEGNIRSLEIMLHSTDCTAGTVNATYAHVVGGTEVDLEGPGGNNTIEADGLGDVSIFVGEDALSSAHFIYLHWSGLVCGGSGVVVTTLVKLR